MRGQTLFWVHYKLVIELLKHSHFLTNYLKLQILASCNNLRIGQEDLLCFDEICQKLYNFFILYKYTMILGSRLWLRIPDYTLLLCLEFWLWTLMLTILAAFWPEELTKLLRFSIRMTNRFVFLIKFDFGVGIFRKIRENAMMLMDNDYWIIWHLVSLFDFATSSLSILVFLARSYFCMHANVSGLCN